MDQLKEPLEHLLSLSSSTVRPKLLKIINNLPPFGLSDEILNEIVDIVESLHSASLLLDDIQDNSDLRRGETCGYKIWGIPTVVGTVGWCGVNSVRKIYNLFDSFEVGGAGAGADADAGIGKDKDKDKSDNAKNEVTLIKAEIYKLRLKEEAVKYYTSEMDILYSGQALDILWRDQHSPPTEQEYMKMVIGKTGGLFRLGVKLLAILGKLKRYGKTNNESAKEECAILVDSIMNWCDHLGMLYQVRDDYLNLTEYQNKKGFAEDITEGKFSYPVVWCVTNRKDSPVEVNELLEILKGHTHDDEQKRRAIELMGRLGGLSACKDKIAQLKTELDVIVQRMPMERRLAGPLVQIVQMLSIL